MKTTKSGLRGVMSWQTWATRVESYIKTMGRDPNECGVLSSMRNCWKRGLTPKQAIKFIYGVTS